jgi:hypothetical protein
MLNFKTPTTFVATAALLALAGCSQPNPRVVTSLNQGASLTGDLPSNPLGWKVITSALDGTDSTMSTLFGNDVAVQYARTNSQHDYPAGSTISMVTWTQQEDPRWFGGKIAAAPKSVEFVTVAAGVNQRPTYSYERFEGAPLKRASAETAAAPSDRMSYLLSQRAAVMP